MSLSAHDVRWKLLALFVLVVAVALHEFGHAVMAYKLGDDTPKRQGRVTLNPLAHADPIGTLLLPLFAGFGWGKPVQWQPHRVRRTISMATASILVAIAGPMMNILLGSVITVTTFVLVKTGTVTPVSDLYVILTYAAFLNFLLFFFNLLPVPPLDGGHVAQSFTPYRYRDKFDQYAKFGPFIVLAMMMIPALQRVFVVPAQWCTQHVFGLFDLPTYFR